MSGQSVLHAACCLSHVNNVAGQHMHRFGVTFFGQVPELERVRLAGTKVSVSVKRWVLVKVCHWNEGVVLYGSCEGNMPANVEFTHTLCVRLVENLTTP